MTQENAQRRLKSWIDTFVEYTNGLPTPEIYRRWGAINALAGLLERRVWVKTAGREAYPNLYTLLVGPPGVGKSEVLREVSRIWKSVKDLPSGRKLHVAPDNMTKAALIKTLSKASTRLVLSEIDLVEYHSLLVVSSEFSVFLPTYDTTFMSVLTDLYDCRDDYTEERISTGESFIPNPQLHLIGGTTPGFMASTFPEQAWTMGFSSRLILIYCEEPVRVSLFHGNSRPENLWAALVHDAKSIAGLYGQLEWLPSAAALLEAWDESGRKPVPTHPKLATYNTRRILQVIKLVIIAAISRSNEMKVREEDVTTALAWLIEAEQHMPSIFKEMNSGGGGTSSLLLDLHHWALGVAAKTGPIREGRLINYVSQKVQYPSQVLPILQLAVKNGMFEISGPDEARLWTPKGGQ